jgi:hypothetical protein
MVPPGNVVTPPAVPPVTQEGTPPATQDGTPPAEGASPAPSDEPASWAKDDVAKAVSLDLIPGHMCNNYAANITRQEFCNVLAQVLRGKNLEVDESAFDEQSKPFGDTDDTDVVWLNSLGIVNGVGGGAFNPAGSITRQEAAVMLKRAAVALGAEDTGAQVSFADQDRVASWAEESLGFVVANGIMNGTGGDRFSPLDMYTRQQSYVTMLRLYNTAPDAASDGAGD